MPEWSIDAERAAAVIGGEYPELGPVRATYLDEGCDSTSFEINGEWVFRFPKRRDVEEQLEVEGRVLHALSSTAVVPIPLFTFLGQPSVRFPMRFAGYRKLAGVVGIRLNPDDVPFSRLADPLGQFLSWLHAFRVSEAANLGVKTPDSDRVIEELVDEALENIERVAETAADAPVQQWRAYFHRARKTVWDAPPRVALLHNDLAAEHVLLDPNTCALTGIIDWSDVRIGDPAMDFAGLFHWGGERFLRAGLGAYDGPVDDQFLARARFFAACRGVGDLNFAFEHGRPEYAAAGLRALDLAIG